MVKKISTLMKYEFEVDIQGGKLVKRAKIVLVVHAVDRNQAGIAARKMAELISQEMDATAYVNTVYDLP
jgi:hypothetical protein